MGAPYAVFKKGFRRRDPVAPRRATGTLVVTVKLQDTLAAFPGARVTLLGGATEAPLTTDAKGTARWEPCAVGDYVVCVEFQGADTQKYEVPAPDQALPSVSKGHTTRCQVQVVPLEHKLRIILIDAKNQPLAGRAWSLTSPVCASGSTGADGLIAVDLGDADGKGTLHVKLRGHRSTTTVSLPAARPTAAYPPSIVPADFTDTAADPVLTPDADCTVEWELTIVDPRKPG